MDLKAMLNDGETAAERPNIATSINRSLSNRTPWSAGGYALPILTNPFSSGLEKEGSESWSNKYRDQRRKESLESPTELVTGHRQAEDSYDNLTEGTRKRFSESSQGVQHQLSDSRSSLSSFVSSPYSSTHSRFSSISTISGYHPVYNSEPESISNQRQECLERFQSSLSSPSTCSTSVPPSRSRASTIPSPELIGGLVRISEHHLETEGPNQVPQSYNSNHNLVGTRLQMCNEANEHAQMLAARSASPSDALMIKRTAVRNDTEYHEPFERRRASGYSPTDDAYNIQQPSLVTSRGTANQRSSSTSIASVPGTRFQYDAYIPHPRTSVTEFTTSSPSDLRSFASTRAFEAAYNASRSQPKGSTSALPEPCCMFMEGCDTNSVPRKAVSHVFGRNKMCTRLIPPHVWVRYCRKHYQRAVYRNPKGWPRLQCDLVQDQIRRLDMWTAENIRKGEGGVVKDWTLALRRREQVRRQGLRGNIDMNTRVETDHEYESDEDGPKHRRSGGHPPVPVPDWLFHLCGSGYSSQQIAEIIDTIHRNIANEILSGIPDIELLPNIDNDRGSRKPAKRPSPRKEHIDELFRPVDGSTKIPDRSRPDGDDNPYDPVCGFGISAKRKHDGNSAESLAPTMPQNQRVCLGMTESNAAYSNPVEEVAPITQFISHRPRSDPQHRSNSYTNASATNPGYSSRRSNKDHGFNISPTSEHLAAAHATLSLYDQPIHQ